MEFSTWWPKFVKQNHLEKHPGLDLLRTVAQAAWNRSSEVTGEAVRKIASEQFQQLSR